MPIPPRAEDRTKAGTGTDGGGDTRITMSTKRVGITDDAVEARTGRDWAGWVETLDAAGAARLDHGATARLLREKFGVRPWWSQMVAVGYQQARGLRDKHQRPDGYSVTVSRTIGVPIGAVFQAWYDAPLRSGWLGDLPVTIRKATINKSLRIVWSDGRTRVDVMLYPKREIKCQVIVQHGKIASADDAANFKAFWGERLGALKAMLEG